MSQPPRTFLTVTPPCSLILTRLFKAVDISSEVGLILRSLVFSPSTTNLNVPEPAPCGL